MPEDLFRVVITVGVGIVCLAAVVIAVVAVALYQGVRKLRSRTEPVMDQVEPLIGRIDRVAERMTVVVDGMLPAIQKLGPAIDEVRPGLARIGPAVDKMIPVFERAQEVLASADRIIEETRPRIAKVSEELAELVHTSRTQAERFGETITEAGDRARLRLEQIDHSVDTTIEQLDELSGSLRRAVTRPVREVNAVASGISAAIATLVRGSHRHSVDTATQDEEMFI